MSVPGARYCPPTYSSLDDTLLNPCPRPRSAVEKALLALSSEARELYLGSTVDEVASPPSPVEMARTWVGGNRPLLIKGAHTHWPAVHKWTIPYLRARVGGSNVSVSVTPSGYADAPNGGYFMLPEERCVAFEEFLDVMENPHTQHGVWYVQKQNSNLSTEFSCLLDDLESESCGREIGWFSETLGKKPDAINFWMGDGRAVTSMHKDPYENIYSVISGYKDFLLIPPSDAPWVPYKKFPLASYKYKPNASQHSKCHNKEKCNTEDKIINGTEKDCALNTSEGGIEKNCMENIGRYVPASIEKLHSNNDRNALESESSSADINDGNATSIEKISLESVRNGPESSLEHNKLYDKSFDEGGRCGCGYLPNNCLTKNNKSSDSSLINLESEHNGSVTPCETRRRNSNNIVQSPECPMFSIVPDSDKGTVPWIAVDPLNPDLFEYPWYSRARALRVRVEAGDVLYLPSLWFHHVTQSHACIAVNYWYDMSFDIKYNYYQLVQALTWKSAHDFQEDETDDDC